jgi:hypothetical protein
LQRNPGLSKAELEQQYLKFFNVKKVIWIPRGVIEDNQVFTGRLPGNLFTCAATGGLLKKNN